MTTDIWLMQNSFSFYGIFSKKEKAVKYTKEQQLKTDNTHVVIDCGQINNFENTCTRVFNTQLDADQKQLL